MLLANATSTIQNVEDAKKAIFYEIDGPGYRGQCMIKWEGAHKETNESYQAFTTRIKEYMTHGYPDLTP